MCNKLRILAIAAVVVLLAAGCASDEGDDGRIKVVVSTTILGDVVSNVVGDGADVEVLIPVGASPHDFIPSSRQVAAIHGADLVVANGLGLEEGLGDVLASAEAEGVNVLAIGPHLTPLATTDGGGVDPHVWMDPVRMEEAAAAIAEALFLIDGNVAWGAHAEAYMAAMRSTDGAIAELLAGIPAERRKLVTNHDSLGYFADRYGLEIVGTVIPTGSALGDPSSAALASLVEVIDRDQVPAIFAETSESQALAEIIAAEAGRPVAVVELYTGSLGEPGSEADTLVKILLLDAKRIAAALGS